jgi:hypothetical protein
MGYARGDVMTRHETYVIPPAHPDTTKLLRMELELLQAQAAIRRLTAEVEALREQATP